MDARITGIVITDTVLFNRTGDIRRWADRVNLAFVANAIEEAPHGADTGRINKTSGMPPGQLKLGIHGSVNRVGPRQLETIVNSEAPYSLFVLKGTNTIIARGEGGRFASVEEGMYIPANPGWGRSKMRQRVRGQKANPFFERAFDATARTHSSLRGNAIIGTF
jgi:hypothetical protein